MCGFEPKAWMPTLFPLQFCNAGYAFPREQFEAADHHAGQQRHALAGIDRLHAL